MDGSSSIPRPTSRLPVPTARLNLRQSSSRDSLVTRDTIANPRLRGTPSRDQLTSTRDKQASSTYTPTKLHIQAGRKPEQGSRKPVESSPAYQQENVNKLVGNGMVRKKSQLELLPSTAQDEGKSRKPRQSLSERTMETLSQLPPSPATRRRDSSFFNPDSPMRPPSRASNSSRPGSSHHPDTSMPPPSWTSTSRPGSSAGYKGEAVPIDFRASTNTFRPPKSSVVEDGVVRQQMSARQLKVPVKAKSNTNLRSTIAPSKPQPTGVRSSVVDKLPTTVKTATKGTLVKSGSKTVAAKPLRPRASVGGLFRKPSVQEMDQNRDRIDTSATKVSPTVSNSSSERASMTSKTSARTTSSIESIVDQPVTPRKSSVALREHIAKAKAAKRASSARKVSGISAIEGAEESSVIPAGTFDFGLSDDPFNLQGGIDGSKGLLRKRIDSARTDGRLNIAAMGLKEIPSEVMNMYNFDAVAQQGGSWAESVDLTRLVAADNELEVLGEAIFPDVDPLELLQDDDSKGNQFGGLETLDLHGNLLNTLPLGLRRLDLLTTLNLSNNKLCNDSFEVISQISSLRDLKIGSNNLSGELGDAIAKLRNLEVLDLQKNHLTSLPEAVVELVRLRVLNLTQNELTSLPFEKLQRLSLVELSAAKNKLRGVLIGPHDVELPQLQVLDVSVNGLTSLGLYDVRLPSLYQLNCSVNRLTDLPDITTWKSLITLVAEDNSISEIPEGFTTLPKLKHVDLTGNNLKSLDDRIGQMESLDVFRISGNPLREKKFSSMTVEDLKKVLNARLAPLEPEHIQEDTSDVYASCPSSPTEPNSSDWPVKAGGTLDRSNTHSSHLESEIAAQIAENNAVRVLNLGHNLFKEIPSSITSFASTLTTLILSHNDLAAETFLDTDLDLPVLKDLNISSNALTSLKPLLTHLCAPNLAILNISFNRLRSLPPLRPSFPSLTVILASNNSVAELGPEAVEGLKVLDASSNDIATLNPRIGLLWEAGLERFDVSGNRFRVPNYRVLEKGTEATLKWLRDRIPVGEGTEGVDEVD